MLFTSGALSDPVFFESVVKHWLSAIHRDRIAVGLSFESPPACIICKNINVWRLVHRFDDPTPTARPLHHTASVTLIKPDREQCGEGRH